MGNNLLSVSIVIPCRNEEKFIGKCLDSIILQNYPKGELEVLVMDGMSKDRTREIIKNYSQKYSFIKLLNNPKKFTSSALNIGIKSSKGEIIVRMDSHAFYDKNYVSKCIEYLRKYKADNVGGVIKTIPKKDTLSAKAIAFILSHRFGAGNSYFRTGFDKPRWVDTVFCGCYNKKVFEKIGFFNEHLIKSEDMEFNLRLKRAGGKILLMPDIVSYYYPKSNLKDFFLHNLKDGMWAVYHLKFSKIFFHLRHYVPFFFVSSLLTAGLLGIFFPIFLWLFLFIIGLYFSGAIYFSTKIAAEEKDIRYLFLTPVAFACRHFGYGLGSIWGLIKLLI